MRYWYSGERIRLEKTYNTYGYQIRFLAETYCSAASKTVSKLASGQLSFGASGKKVDKSERRVIPICNFSYLNPKSTAVDSRILRSRFHSTI